MGKGKGDNGERRGKRAASLPFVSCICATYNRAPDHLRLVEEAVEAFLRQDYPNKELLILNDTPGQSLACDAPGVRVVNLPVRFRTLGEKRNALVALASGDLLAPWDDDDLSLPWRLSLSVERIGDAGYYNPVAMWHMGPGGIIPRPTHGVGHMLSLFRRDAFLAAGGYPSISLGEDQVIDHALRRSGDTADGTMPGGGRLSRREIFYLYRWGASPTHLSSVDDEHYYERLGDLPVESGTFTLRPHWRADYTAIARRAARNRPPKEKSTAPPAATGKMPTRFGGKPAIWMVWPGDDPMPDLLHLCLETVRRHNGDDFAVILVTPDNLHRYLDPHPAYEFLSYVHRADHLRLALLHHHGGVYLDMDTIALRSLKKVYRDLKRHDIVTYDGGPWGEVFGVSAFGPTRRQSLLTTGWSLLQNAVLDDRLDDLIDHRRVNPDPRSDCLGWTEILRDVVDPLGRRLRDAGLLSAKLLPPRWGHVTVGLPAYDTLLGSKMPTIPDTELLILNHAILPNEVKRLSAAEILNSDLVICRLVQRALGVGRG